MELVLFFIKAKTVLFPAAVCVPIATEIWNRPMEHMLIIETEVSFLQKQQETTGVNIFLGKNFYLNFCDSECV